MEIGLKSENWQYAFGKLALMSVTALGMALRRGYGTTTASRPEKTYSRTYGADRFYQTHERPTKYRAYRDVRAGAYCR